MSSLLLPQLFTVIFSLITSTGIQSLSSKPHWNTLPGEQPLGVGEEKAQLSCPALLLSAWSCLWSQELGGSGAELRKRQLGWAVAVMQGRA